MAGSGEKLGTDPWRSVLWIMSTAIFLESSGSVHRCWRLCERLLCVDHMRCVWFRTILGLSMGCVWRVGRIFPCMVYIDLNRRDSWIWVSLVCSSHHVDNLTNLMGLSVVDVVFLNTLNYLHLLYDYFLFEMIWVEVKFESIDSLLARVWHSIELIPIKSCILGVSYLWPRWQVSFTEL
jgi:hypothetical protein